MGKYVMFFAMFCSFPLWSCSDGDDSWTHVAMAAASGKPLHIVLGAKPHEAHVAHLSPAAIRIFVDLDTSGEGISTPSTPFIKTDFNLVGFWQKIAEALPQKIDAVYCDIFVAQFISWSAPTLTTLMEGCLKPGGALFLPQMRLASEAPQHPVWIPFDPKTQVAERVLRSVDRTTLPWHLGANENRTKDQCPTFVVDGNGGILTCVRDGHFVQTPSYVMDTYLQESVTRHMGYEGYPDIGLTSRPGYEERVASFSYVQFKRKG